MAVVWEIAGMALVVTGFVEVKADKGLVARFSAWVLVGAIFGLMVARPEKVSVQSSRSILSQGFER